MNPPVKPPRVEDILGKLGSDRERLLQVMLRIQKASSGVAPGGKYRHWDNLRHLRPPEGLSQEEWWLGIKWARQNVSRPLPLKDAKGRPLTYSTPDEALELLHFIDQHASGELVMPEEVLENQAARQHYLVNSLIEEAIRSSQLEGATTSHVVAKEMIRSGRPPRDRSETMILNNYRAMEYMHEEMGDRLEPEMVLQLHRILTDGTLDNPEAAGRLQRPDEPRVAVFENDRLTYQPPPADQLPRRLAEMCAFANEEGGTQGFLHPVVRSILIHFWLAFDHPFEDGNGRTARTLFYWSMKTRGYWLTEYLSVSRILREAPSKYARAFLFTETDDGDTTYFILYQLAVIRRAIEELHEYLRRKVREIRRFEDSIRSYDDFNHRQLALLSDAVRHPTRRYTFKSHARSHKVTRQTARTDLLQLTRRGLFERNRSGREYVFEPVSDLQERLTAGDHKPGQLLKASAS